MDKKIILFGYSGHAYSVIDAVHSMDIEISGYLDFTEKSSNPYHLNYLGSEHTIELTLLLKAKGSVTDLVCIKDQTIKKHLFR